MINAYRRGYQTASEQIHKYPASLPKEEIQLIGEQTFAEMKQAGYAHIEPQEDFIKGFTESFQLQSSEVK